MADDGFHEIQLGRKQLFFVFLAGTVLLILVFIIGVWVGRGVRKPEAEVAADVPAADAPVAGGSNQPTQVSPGELDYSKLLDAEGRSAVDKPAAKAAEPPTPPPDTSDTTPVDLKTAAAPVPAAPATAAPKGDAKGAEAVKPGAKPETKPAAKAVSPFMLQVGAFAEKRAADALVANLSKKGFPATVVTAANTPAPYKVRVGPYTDRDAADAASARLKKEGFKPLVTR
jgi:DedD protein